MTDDGVPGDLQRVGNQAGEAYARYTRSGDRAHFEEGVRLMERVMRLERERTGSVSPHTLYNLSHLHLSRYAREQDREALAKGYALLLEATAAAPHDQAIKDRSAEAGELLHQAIRMTDRQDVEWYVALHRAITSGDRPVSFVGWAHLSIGLRSLYGFSRSDDHLRELAAAAERAAPISPRRSPGHLYVLDLAARSRLYLAATYRGPTDARKAVFAYQELVLHRASDAEEQPADRERLAMARLLAYACTGDAKDRRGALAALRELADVPVERLRTDTVQDVLASILPRCRGGRDAEVALRGTEFGLRCLERMDARTDVRHEVTGLLNTLGLFLAERPALSRDGHCSPVRHPDDPPTGPGVRGTTGPTVRHAGLAERFARLPPFGTGPTQVSGATGKVYLDNESAPTVVRWQADGKSPLEGTAVSWYAQALVLPPGSGQGAAPNVLPARDHRVAVTLTAPRRRSAVIRDVRVSVLERSPVDRGTSVDSMTTTQRPPAPDLNVLLDFDPPLLHPIQGRFDIPAGGTRTIVVRAATESHAVRWRLELDWRCGLRSGTFTLVLATTGENGYRSFTADGPLWHAPGYLVE